MMPKLKRRTKAGAAIQRRLARIAKASKDSLNAQESYGSRPSKMAVCYSEDGKGER